MDNPDWLIAAYKVNKKGETTKFTNLDATFLETEDTDFSWIHMEAKAPQTEKWLYEESGLDDIWVMSLLAQDTRPSVSYLSNGAMIIILRGINLNENEEPEDMVSIRLYVDRSRVISVRLRKLKAVEEIERRLDSGEGPVTSSEFISTLVHLLCNRLDPTFGQMNEELDDIEEEILNKPDVIFRQKIIDLRKRIILFRRYLAPQRDVLHSLSFTDKSWLFQDDRHSLAESQNKTTRYVEDLDSMRERTQIVQDELNNYLTDKLNKNTYKLSIVASIFLPLSFLTGLFGVNLAGIPSSTNQTSFSVFCVSLVVVIIIQIIVFKKLDWL
jgi:zinc transporter